MQSNENILLIPANEPDEKLLGLLRDMKRKTNFKVIVVNDGSSTRNSWQIYKNLIKFSMTSITSFLLDFTFYSLLLLITKDFSSGTSLFLSNIIARIFSASFNFYLNKKYVFQNHESLFKTGMKYLGLAVFILCMNTALLSLIVKYMGLNPFFGKIIVEIALFFFSWLVQRIFVFQKSSQTLKYANSHKKNNF